MNESDINNIVKLLTKAIKLEDWELIDEALEYLQEFLDDDSQFEEE